MTEPNLPGSASAREAGMRRDGLARPLARLLRTGRDPLLLGAAVILPRATGFLTLPIYSRTLGPEDFGRYELLISVVALAYAICTLGLDFALAVRYYGHVEKERRRDVASALLAAAGSSFVVAGVLTIGSGALGPLALQSSTGWLPFAIAAVAVPFNVIGGILAVYLRLRSHGSAFFRAMLLGAGGGTFVGLVLVVYAGLGLVGAVVGLTAVHMLTFALLALGSAGSVSLRAADRTTIGLLVRIGAPLVPAGAASWVFALADRFFVAAFLGLTQLGLYASAARLAAVLSLAQYGFHAAWGPMALRWGLLADRDVRYAASLRLVAVVGGAAAAITSWLAGPLLWLLAGPDYLEATSVVWLLACAVLFSAMFLVVQIGANLAQRGRLVAMAVLTAAIVNTMANIALIPALGYVGAGFATLVTYALSYLLMYALSERATPLDIGFVPATGWAVAWTVIAASSIIVPPSVRPAADVLVVSGVLGVAVWGVVVGLRGVGGSTVLADVGSDDVAEGRSR